MRQILNESAAGLYVDTPDNLIQAINGGYQQFYRDVMGLLRQVGPVNPHHAFVRRFIVTDDGRLDANEQDIGPVPDTYEETLFVGIAQPEPEIGGTARHYDYRPAMPVSRVEEALTLISRNVGIRQGLAAWFPYFNTSANATYIRVYVYPGRNGIPLVSTPYRHSYLAAPAVLVVTSAELAIPEKFLDPVLWYACAHAVPRERKAYESYLALGQSQVPGIAGVAPQQAGA